MFLCYSFLPDQIKQKIFRKQKLEIQRVKVKPQIFFFFYSFLHFFGCPVIGSKAILSNNWLVKRNHSQNENNK